jgi:Mg-chelatase subunit ChlI
MKPKDHQFAVAFPVTRVVVMMAFLSTILMTSAIPSFAASESKKSPVMTQTSAVEHTEARIKELRGVLKITDAQANSWDTLTLVMRENAKEMDILTKNRDKNAKPLNAVEEMKFHSQISETRLNQTKKFIPLFEDLYASMSDEQKKNADIVFQKGIMRNHKRK